MYFDQCTRGHIVSMSKVHLFGTFEVIRFCYRIDALVVMILKTTEIDSYMNIEDQLLAENIEDLHATVLHLVEVDLRPLELSESDGHWVMAGGSEMKKHLFVTNALFIEIKK